MVVIPFHKLASYVLHITKMGMVMGIPLSGKGQFKSEADQSELVMTSPMSNLIGQSQL